MSRTLGNTIADSLQLSLGYADRLLTDIRAEQFARFAAPGSVVVESNHPAFIFGHLNLYAPIITAQLGRDALAVGVPEIFQATCSKDAKCQDDLEGTIYASMDQTVDVFRNVYGNALTALREASDDTLQQPNPGEGRMVELFPTLGSLHAFYTGGHIMMHMGQLSAWRRMRGMGPA